MEELFTLRRALLVELAESGKYGQKKEIAVKSGIAQSYLSRQLSDKKGAKPIGEELALRIEAALDLEPGYLLFPSSLRPDPGSGSTEPWPLGTEVTRRRLEALPPRRLKKIKRMVLAEVEEWEDEQGDLGKAVNS